MVVRPADEGNMRLPWSAKKMALMSSDLPRENSATKATLSRSSRRRSRRLLEAQVGLGVGKLVIGKASPENRRCWPKGANAIRCRRQKLMTEGHDRLH